jgi:hypothetical protein
MKASKKNGTEVKILKEKGTRKLQQKVVVRRRKKK